MQTLSIKRILEILKNKYLDAYMLESTGQVVVETPGRKRGSRASVATMSEADARREAMSLLSPAERFEAVNSASESCEHDAADTQREAEIEEPPVVSHVTVAAQKESDLLQLKRLSSGSYNWLMGRDIRSIEQVRGAMEILALHVLEGDDLPTSRFYPLLIGDIAMALSVHFPQDREVWRNLALVARDALMAQEADAREARAEPEAEMRPTPDAYAESAVERIQAQVHGGTGAEVRNKAAQAKKAVDASLRQAGLTPIARFVVKGVRYSRRLERGVMAETDKLRQDIRNKWGEAAFRRINTTLVVAWGK